MTTRHTYALAGRAAVPGPEANHPRASAHVSLLLFTSQPDYAATLDAVRRYRETNFGVARFERVDLVAFTRKRRAVSILRLAMVPLPC